MYFKTERLIARKLVQNDFTAFNNMQTNHCVMKHTLGRAKTIEENREELENILKIYTLNHTNKQIMGVVRKSDNMDMLIGTCAVINKASTRFEIGYRFSEEYWGSGYGLEILEGLVTYCLTELKAKEITAEVYKENVPSIRLLEKSSLEFVREYVEGDKKVLLYALIKKQ